MAAPRVNSRSSRTCMTLLSLVRSSNHTPRCRGAKPIVEGRELIAGEGSPGMTNAWLHKLIKRVVVPVHSSFRKAYGGKWRLRINLAHWRSAAKAAC